MNFDDPQMMGLLAMGSGLLKASGPSTLPQSMGSALGEAGQGGILAMQNAKRMKMAEDMQRAQMERLGMQNSMLQTQMAQQQKAQEQAQMLAQLRGGILGTPGTPPTAALGQGASQGDVGPTMTNEQRIQPGNPYGLNMDGVKRYIAAGGDPKDVGELMKLGPQGNMAKLNPKDFTPDSFSQYLTTGRPEMLRAARKLDNVNGVAMDLYSAQPGQVLPQDPNKPFSVTPSGVMPNKAYQDYQTNRAKAGASNVNVSTEKTLLGGIAGNVAGQIGTLADNAKAAVNTINTVNRIREGIAGGNVIAGPGADARVFLSQLGNVLGVQGADSQEKMINTRQVIQGMAQLELDGAQQMKGQGQITEGERAIVKRAASGDINMTVPEIGLLMDVLEKVARQKIKQNKSNVDKLKKNPNAAGLVDFIDVQEPPAAGGLTIRRID